MRVSADPSLPLRVDGYVRVSQVGQRKGERFISPRVQREEIEAWAERRGARLLTVFEELDESGGRRDRPLLSEAVGRVEAGISQGLVVHRTDRFGRSLIDGLLTIQRIHEAEGVFFSVGDGLDTSTDSGRLVLRIMLSLAECDAERTRANWEVARADAIARGVYVGGWVPPGYRKTRSGRLQPDPVVAPVIAELFERRARGEIWAALDRLLEERGVLTARGYRGWVGGAARLIKRREYLGEVRGAGRVNERAHPPLVDLATWHAAQKPILKRPPRVVVDALLGGGMVRCAGCGMALTATNSHRAGARYVYVYYQSAGHFPGGTCTARAGAPATLLEPCVEDVVFTILRHRRRAPATALKAAADELEQARQALIAYRDSDHILRAIGDRRFAAGLATRAERIRDLSLELDALRARHAVHQLPPADELEAKWPAMTIKERRVLIATVIDCVFLSAGDDAVDQRVIVCPAGTAPLGLRRTGHRVKPLRQYKPRREWIKPDPVRGHVPPWSTQRLERELASFIGNRRGWPSRREFWTAGRARLHRQVVAHGGDAYWASQFGLPLEGHPFGAWTEDRVRAALAQYLQGKNAFPTGRQFKADGKTTLWKVIGRAGGCRRWATEFNLPNPKRAEVVPTYWTPERIANDLKAFTRGRDTFPQSNEFVDAGRGPLLSAIYRYGGADWWARQFGLARLHPIGPAKDEHPIPARLFPMTDIASEDGTLHPRPPENPRPRRAQRALF